MTSESKPNLRAVRKPGRKTRSHLLDVAVRLFREHGLGGVSVAEIAAAADVFPSQITYYFRTKEALFVEGACREVLYVAQRAEERSSIAATREDYRLKLVETVLASDGLQLFVEALNLTRRRQDLAPQIERTFDRLFDEGSRAYTQTWTSKGWNHDLRPDTEARRFWTLAIGTILRGSATGMDVADCIAEMVDELVFQDQASDRRGNLKIVGNGSGGKI